MAAGAFGLSTGLLYETGNFLHDSRSHRVDQGGGRPRRSSTSVTFATRASISWPSLQEVIDIGRASGAPVQVSHIKIGVKKLWGTSDKVLKLLNDARASGVDITADIYPYTYWQSTMRVMFPNKVYDDGEGLSFMLKESTPPDGLYFSRFQPDPTIVGKSLAQVAKERNAMPADRLSRPDEAGYRVSKGLIPMKNGSSRSSASACARMMSLT